MDSWVHMYKSRASYEDQMAGVTRRFLFMHDMEKYERSIFDRTYMT